jgi:hypothetical protein
MSILCLLESADVQATSSIDLETDEAVQQILRGSDFHGVTTITVTSSRPDEKSRS